MNCTQCGRALDAQALELGACRYCGQPIPDAGTMSISETGAAGADYPPTGAASLYDPGQSHYEWKDWPTASVPAPGGTHPTLPGLGGVAENAESVGTTTGNALTLPGTGFFAAPGGTSAGAGAPPLPGPPPSGASAWPHIPAQPSYPPPGAPGRRRGKLLAIVGLVLIILVILIGSGVLFANTFNKSPASGSATGGPIISTAPPTVTPTTQPTATPTARPTSTATPAPPALQTYRDPNRLFTIGYPTGWAVGNVALPITSGFVLNGVQFKNGAARFTIATGQQPAIPIPPDQVDSLVLTSLGVSNQSAAQTVTIGGQPWTQESGDSNVGRHTVAASTNFNDRLYTIVYSAPTSEFPSDNAQAFSLMIASFRFGA